MLKLTSRTQDRHTPLPSAGVSAHVLKEAAVTRWVARHLGEATHERQVMHVASELFDLTRPIHGLGIADRRLLRLAALVHDVGRAVCKATHPAEGAAMILAADRSLPLTGTERRQLAYLTTYHKGDVPSLGADTVLSPHDDADRLLTLLALLRAADALDGRSIETPRLVFALAGKTTRSLPLRLRVHVYLHEDTPKARKVYSRRKKFRLLENLFGVEVEIEIARAHALRMVA
jgi:exopolyphosphatase/pppGpp-phosphohydrolase